jgi:hypothetical protein
MSEAGARPHRYAVGQRVRVTNPRLAAYGQVGEIIRVDLPGGYHVRLEEERPVPRVLFFLGVELAPEEPEQSSSPP